MESELTIDDFINIDVKFENIREEIDLWLEEYNRTIINYGGIDEFLDSTFYDDFINGETMTRESTQLVYISAGLLKEPIDLKLSIVEKIFRVAGVDISTTVRPPEYDYMLGLALGLQSIYDAA
jgi:hypothetical protein